nr:hypothetical protein [Streptomyces yokosukanensis]
MGAPHPGRAALPHRHLHPESGRTETFWVGRDAIVEGRLSRQPWQDGGSTFEASVLLVTGDTAAIDLVRQLPITGRVDGVQ